VVFDRRTFLGLAALPMVAAVLDACGSDEVAPAEVGEVRDDGTRVVAAVAESVDGTAAVNGFGTSLYRRLAAADPTGNLVMSPFSIALALTMTMAGARGQTLDEMIATLDVDDAVTIHRSMNALTTALDDRNSNDVRVSIANSLWGQSGTPFETDFLELLTAEYGAGMQTVDYADDTEAARLAINGWVDEHTEHRIAQLIAPGLLDDLTRLVLVNAVHLQADWARPFMPEATSPAAFTTASGQSVQVPFMAQTAAFQYATGDGWRAVELPYVGDGLAMLIFVPEDGFLALFESIFLVTDATEYLQPQQVALRMPKFDIAASFSLRDQLVEMGMSTAFGTDADFTGMTTDEPLHISAVVHQANITVDEQGTEAAAATAVGVAGSGLAPEEPIEFTIDRPFVFALRDRQTGAIVFMGRVGDPTG
jgi:serpin B